MTTTDPTLTRRLPARTALTPVAVLGVGSAAPDRVLDNARLEQLVDTSDEWIVSRTGMRERRIVATGETTSDLAAQAAFRALDAAGMRTRDVALILVATVTPDTMCPSTACHVQRKIGAMKAAGFDISAACSGFGTALMTGQTLVAAGTFENALVIGADTLTAVTDYSDRGTCVLFGDGAGAAVLGPSMGSGAILDHVVRMDGSGADLITLGSGLQSQAPGHEDTPYERPVLRLQGRAVFRFAVAKIEELVRRLLQRNCRSLDDVDLVVPHQANLRILEAAAERLSLPREKLFVNVDRYGNTSSGSIPLALDDAVRTGRLRRGMLVCTVAFGGGLTWAGSLIRW